MIVENYTPPEQFKKVPSWNNNVGTEKNENNVMGVALQMTKWTQRICIFDPISYGDLYTDVYNAFKGDPVQITNHWKIYGIREGRSPCGLIKPECKFDTRLYESLHPDLKAAYKGDPQGLSSHYLIFGVDQKFRVC